MDMDIKSWLVFDTFLGFGGILRDGFWKKLGKIEGFCV